MPFCSKCGASVEGKFCSKCGAPAAASSSQAAPPPSPGPVVQPPVGPRKTSPLVWVLVVVLGLFLLGGLAIGGFTMFVFHKAREAGISPDLWQRNPAAATARALALANADIEILGEDDGAGTVTIRDRHTGKTTTWNLDQARHGGITISTEGANGESASVNIGSGGSHKLPSWLPAYPGASESGNFSITGSGSDGAGGTFSFTTSDPPGQVLSFYQDKIRELKMDLHVNATTPDGGVLTGTSDDRDRTLNVIVGHDSGKTSVNVTYASK